MRSSWVTIQGTTKQEEKARRNRAANQTIRQLASMGAIGVKMLLPADQKRHVYRCRALPMRNVVKQETAQKQLEAEMGIPAQNTIGGDCMDELDRKVIAAFPGKSVRKDLTSLMKKGANVPPWLWHRRWLRAALPPSSAAATAQQQSSRWVWVIR